MKEKSLTKTERQMIARVKKEMDKPRLTLSVRNGFGPQAAPAVKKPATCSPRA